MKWVLLWFLFVLLLFTSCCASRKTKTITRIETITKIDTVLIIKRDTIPLVKKVLIHDTAYLENSTSKAKSYYDSISHKIVLKLEGKQFNVPLTIYKREITNKKEIINEGKCFQWKFWLLLLLNVLGFTGYIYFKYIKK